MKKLESSKTKQVTLKDIADSLGISKATVSLCLNNSPLASKKTLAKVMLKIEQMGYVYNRRAAGLATGKSNTVGLCVHDITSPYFTHLCAGVDQVLNEQGKMSFLCNSSESSARQLHFIATLIEHNADGLLLCPAAGTTTNELAALFKHRLPTVLITREIEGFDCDFVGNDERLAMHLATRHLLDLGHTKIAFLGGNYMTSVAKDRRAGFMDAMRVNGHQSPETLLFDCDNHPSASEKLMSQLLNNPDQYSAILCFSDHLAFGVISSLLKNGLTPGKEVSVVGCDDIDESGRIYTQLTTINIQKYRLGAIAAELLERRLQAPSLPIQRKILMPELVIRKSSGQYHG